MTAAGRKASGRAQNLTCQVAFLIAIAVKSAFAFTFDESNKARARKPRSMPITGANMTDKRKGKIAYGENDKCNDRKRFCEP